MSQRLQGLNHRTLFLCVALVLAFAGINQYLFSPAYGARLGNRTLRLSNNQVTQTATYQAAFSFTSASVLGSIVIDFCSNDALVEDPCTAPNGFDAKVATLASQTGQTGFTVSNSSTANHIVLTRLPLPATAGPVSYTFDGVINPSDAGSYYARLQTFASSDASGSSNDYGGLAFVINSDLAVSALVPPYLIFCSALNIANLNCATASGSILDLGELSSTQTRSGSSELLTATNAKDGYSITISGNTMTSGNNVIPAIATSDVSRPGVGQFGINLTANSTPSVGATATGPGVAQPEPLYSQSDQYRFNSGEVVVKNSVPDDVRKYTASYIVNVPAVQPPGLYVSTITYVCLANF